MFLPQLLVSLLIGFLYVKAFLSQSSKRKFYLISFFTIIIFLIIRLLKNHFASPFVLNWGGDPLVLLTPQFTLPQAIFNAAVYGPGALMDRTDPQTKMIAINISIAIDFVISIIGGYIFTLIIQKKNNKYLIKKNSSFSF